MCRHLSLLESKYKYETTSCKDLTVLLLLLFYVVKALVTCGAGRGRKQDDISKQTLTTKLQTGTNMQENSH